MQTRTATRYVAPLREGGSLPAIVEADDGHLYVIKFRGSGQGPKALIAELLAGEILRALGLPVPVLALMHFDDALARAERDQEIQELLQRSVGQNIALGYLSGALPYDPLLRPLPAPELASAIVWGDAFLTNVDRTARNPNLLLVDSQLWLIDHGAALYFHHDWDNYLERSRSRFPQVRQHILLPAASAIAAADAALVPRLTPALFEQIVAWIPDDWLTPEADGFASTDEQRAAYTRYLTTRLEAPRLFAEEAIDAYRNL
ncbi:MAG: aminotransferase class I and II [Chloroflexaceae bacterium]|nr:aminotransferase class I and II [Chloroflexaceae bacterium]